MGKKSKHFQQRGAEASAKPKQNPFELKYLPVCVCIDVMYVFASHFHSSCAYHNRNNRRKFEVLGQKLKGEQGNRLHARDQAIKVRQRTLLVDMKQRNKSNNFTDRRFGEYDKVLLRCCCCAR